MKELVLVGGGHSHVAVLDDFGRSPPAGVRTTLVSRNPATPYSGMLPGVVAGHYAVPEAHIDLEPLARFASARFVCDEVVGVDVQSRRVRLAGGGSVAYDVLSIDSGSAPAVPAAAASLPWLVAVKPIDGLLERWQSLLARLAARAAPVRIAVVGGGAGGVELLLAAKRRLDTLGIAASFVLLTEGEDVLPTYSVRVRERFGRILAARGVEVRTQVHVTGADGRGLVAVSGETFDCDVAFWVTGGAAAPWIAASGIAVDARGFMLVESTLRSASHSDIFGAGDAVTMRERPELPKAGVVAVRQGKPLARNLRAALAGRALAPFSPQRRYLSLIGTGDERAVASRGVWSVEGRWVWRLKRYIDRRFVRKYHRVCPKNR